METLSSTNRIAPGSVWMGGRVFTKGRSPSVWGATAPQVLGSWSHGRGGRVLCKPDVSALPFGSSFPPTSVFHTGWSCRSCFVRRRPFSTCTLHRRASDQRHGEPGSVCGASARTSHPEPPRPLMATLALALGRCWILGFYQSREAAPLLRPRKSAVGKEIGAQRPV